MKHNTVRDQRRASAIVEIAVVLPVIVVFLLGATEFGRALRLQNLLEEAAQAGCRVYSAPDTSLQAALDVIDAAMAAGGVQQYQVVMDPPAKSGIVAELQPVTVSLSLAYDAAGSGGSWFFAGKTLQAAAVLPGEL